MIEDFILGIIIHAIIPFKPCYNALRCKTIFPFVDEETEGEKAVK